MLPPPRDGPREAVFERGPRHEAEALLGAPNVEAATGLPVRLRGVPHESAAVAHGAADEVGEILDRDLLAAAEVDRVGAVVFLRRSDQPFGRVLDVEELARR